MAQDNKLYEAAYLISPAYSEEEAQNFQQILKNHVQSLGGLIDQEGEIVKRRISYPIRKMTEAYLASFRFILAPEKLNDFQSQLNTKEVLRYLLVLTKRMQPRPIRTRPINMLAQEKVFSEKKIAVPSPQLQPAANIEEIDKKLEEILGK